MELLELQKEILARRAAQLCRADAAAKALIPAIIPEELPVQHFFADGVYGRNLKIPAQRLAIGKIHKKKVLQVIMKGTVLVFNAEDGTSKQFVGPAIMVSEPPAQRILYTLTDVDWLTVHGTHETDLAVIEAEFTAKDLDEFEAYCRQLIDVDKGDTK